MSVRLWPWLMALRRRGGLYLPVMSPYEVAPLLV